MFWGTNNSQTICRTAATVRVEEKYLILTHKLEWKWKLVAQSCLALCDPLDCSPPGSSVCGILQARILEWVAISYSRGSSWPRERTQVCCVSCTGGQVVCHYCHLGSPLGPSTLVQLLSNTDGELLDWRRATMCGERDLPGSSEQSTPAQYLPSDILPLGCFWVPSFIIN